MGERIAVKTRAIAYILQEYVTGNPDANPQTDANFQSTYSLVQESYLGAKLALGMFCPRDHSLAGLTQCAYTLSPSSFS